MFLAILTFVAATAALTTAPVPVRLELIRKASSLPPISGTLTFTPGLGPGVPITIPCCDGDLTVALPANSAWELQPHLHGAWAARQMIVVGKTATSETLPLWPLAQVRGRLQAEKGIQLPSSLALELLDLPTRKSGIPPGNVIDCGVEPGGTFACDVPALAVDLLIHVDGFVPLQVWGCDLAVVKMRDLGPLLLRKGASVSGWVQFVGGPTGDGIATAALVPLVAAAGSAATAERVGRPLVQAPVLKNGFFQLAGVPPGQYAVRVERAGYATETIAPVRIHGGRETAIRRPIVLRPPVSVTVSVVPPRDWRGEPWAMFITKASPLSGGFDAAPLFQGRAADGRVVMNGQSAGRYSIDIFDSGGNPLKNEQFDVDGSADAAHEIRVDVITVHGTATIGERPLETTLWFGGRHGAQHAAMRSDMKGVFRGVLPTGGEWRVTAVVDEQDVETTVTAHGHDGEAVVEVKLPDNQVTGVVVDDKGDSVFEADVTVLTAHSATTHRSGRNGQFSFRAVEAGDISLAASARRNDKLLTSEAVVATIAEEASPPPVQLILRDGQRLTGTVKSIHGAIPGAAVTIVPALDQTTATTTTTDLEGHFIAFVAGAADRAYVTVRPPGYALRVFDVSLPNHGIGLNVPQGGGTLEIVFPKSAGGNLALLLFQDDRPLPLPEVARWAMSQGTPPTNDGIHAANMAPAQYRACIGYQQLVRRNELPRWIAAARCTAGTLAPFGTLRLEMASIDAGRQ
jgi:hypothetical protein